MKLKEDVSNGQFRQIMINYASYLSHSNVKHELTKEISCSSTTCKTQHATPERYEAKIVERRRALQNMIQFYFLLNCIMNSITVQSVRL